MAAIFTTKERPVTEMPVTGPVITGEMADFATLGDAERISLERASGIEITNDENLAKAREAVFADFVELQLNESPALTIPETVPPSEREMLEAELALATEQAQQLEEASQVMCSQNALPINCSLCDRLNRIPDLQSGLENLARAAASKLQFLTTWDKALGSNNFELIRGLSRCIQNVASSKMGTIVHDAYKLSKSGNLPMTNAIANVALSRSGILDVDRIFVAALPNLPNVAGTGQALNELAHTLGVSTPSDLLRRKTNIPIDGQAWNLDRVNQVYVTGGHNTLGHVLGSGDALVTSALAKMTGL